ncbi:hypothetical protein [Halalkalibacter oceani]|uniref:hypothetical protein n=1 Tax=Halalkalibacter oceani TaxID=1653776 RepID=UPI0033972E8B
MEQLTSQIGNAVKTADQVLASSINNWLVVQSHYPSNEQALFLASQALEIAHIYSCMTRGVSGICMYVIEGNQEGASTSLYEVFQEIDNLHTKTPNERSQTSYEVIFGAMSAVKEDDFVEARKYLGTMAHIADMTRLSVLDHMEALEPFLDQSSVH